MFIKKEKLILGFKCGFIGSAFLFNLSAAFAVTDLSICIDQNGTQNEAQLLEISSVFLPGSELKTMPENITGIQYQNLPQLTQGNALYNADGSLVNEYKIGGEIPNSMQSLLDRGFFKVLPMGAPESSPGPFLGEPSGEALGDTLGENQDGHSNPRTISSMLRSQRVLLENGGYKKTQDQILQKTQWFLDQPE